METKVKAHIKNWQPSFPFAFTLQRNDQNGWYEGEVSLDEANLLLESMEMCGGQLFLATQFIDVDLYFCTDDTLEVEVFDQRDGFSAIAAGLDLVTGRKIVEIAFNDERFSDVVPTTEKPWSTSANV
jgi:hypothetical protein